MVQSKRACVECGEILSGRADQKFCSDQCRSHHNNQLKRPDNNLVRNTNFILMKNRRILQDLAPNDKANVHKNKLNEKGFNFSFCTSIYKTKKGDTYYFCYDYGYLPIENDYFLLVKKKEQ